MQEDKLIVFSLALGSVGLYGSFLPPVSEVASTTQSEDEKRILREAEFIGTAHLMVVAGLTAYLAKSSFPLLLATILAVSMFATYEYAIARIPKE